MGTFATAFVWGAFPDTAETVVVANEQGSATLTWDSSTNPTLEVGEQATLVYDSPFFDDILVTVTGFTADGDVIVADVFNQIFVLTDRTLGFGDVLTFGPEGSICFLAGTRIATPAGETPVEALRPGDLVLTADGRSVPVRFIGRQTVDTRFTPDWRCHPIRIAAGALGDAVPARDLFVSPNHALVVDGVLAMASALVNGTTIRQVPPPAARFVWYSIETDAHEAILAEGCPAETFMDHVPRRWWDNHAEYLALHGAERPIAESALPHAKSRRQVPATILAGIAARAAVPGAPRAAA